MIMLSADLSSIDFLTVNSNASQIRNAYRTKFLFSTFSMFPFSILPVISLSLGGVLR